MTNYDETILQGYVDELYNRANWIVGIYTVGGLAVGAFIGVIYDIYKVHEPAMGCIFAGVLGGVVAAYVGQIRSWNFRFEAQKMLLQMQIERNTRWVAAWCSTAPSSNSK